ncbi:MAG TPA: glycosyltransferase family 2 protein [Ferruginibacter sp.]|nr:glycosyltransferase family 2 protein [Ferruginibacter sp.]
MLISNPKVSIIMPTWNRAACIIESVESVLSQTYQNWELIIVDDGSQDNTAELISQITDPRIQFYEAGKIGIGIRLKNIGIERSDGDLIAFLDSDDLWAPSKLEKQVAVFYEYPEAGFSLTGGYNFREREKPLEYFYKQREGFKYGNIFISFFTSEASLLVPSLMFGKQCLPVIRQFTETNPSSDVDFLLGLALNFKAVILYEPLLYRRLHDGGYSIMNWEKGYLEGIQVINAYKNKKHLPSKIAKDALFRLYINYGEKCLLYKKRKMAIRIFLKAWANKPFSIVPLKKTGKAVLRYLKNS